MKIFLIGGTGTIGRVVADRFKADHHVIMGGRSRGDVYIDLADEDTIKTALDKVGMVDAIICIAGEARWAPFHNLSEDDFYIGIKSKLMGQVNLVRLGRHHINPGGSITLSSGILADEPVLQTTSAAMVNGAINSFVKAVNLELKTIRVNVVSLGLVADAYDLYKDFFPGHNPVPMHKVANAYVKCVEGWARGEVLRVYE